MSLLLQNRVVVMGNAEDYVARCKYYNY